MGSHNNNKPLVPKEEMLDIFSSSSSSTYAVGEHGASSSGTGNGNNVRSFLIDMGFHPSLVHQLILQKGEDDVDLLLNTLTSSSVVQPSNSASSDSLDTLFHDKDAINHIPSSLVIPKEEHCDTDDSKRASLLMMNFPVNDVDFAIDKLGGDAPVNELVDFIIAAQIAQNLEKEPDDTICSNGLKNEENEETLFVTMEKTLRLLEMGFSENEVSLAIEKFGSDTEVSGLADSIVTGRIAGNYPGNDKYLPMSFSIGGLHTPEIKAEEFNQDAVVLSKGINIEEILKGKRPKEEHMDAFPDPIPDFEVNYKGKRPKPEYADDFSSFLDHSLMEVKVNQKSTRFDMPPLAKSNPSRSLDRTISKPPFFLYGNVLDVPRDSWVKISKFLYAIEPEFVNTLSFSALSRNEGYVHNLPVENRFHILPKPAMIIKDVIPHTKKWWPSWDTRQQLTCISSETRGISQLCDRLTKTLTDSGGKLSSEQQRNTFHHCIALNLIWVGQFKLAPIEPEHLERMLGYPINHTQDAESSLTERLRSLKYCFQTDTLGYYLSVLKPMYPEGLTVLSIFSGIGGAEIALHRLGIHLKGVISVESSGAKRKIMQKWWRSSGQTGELEQIEDIHKLTSSKIHNLIKKFGGFDLVVCQNPCSRSSTSSKMGGDDEGIASFDFPVFYEFVRVLQGVRSSMERKR